MDDIIIVIVDSNNNAILEYPKANIKTKAIIGKNGVTNDKCEGDMKTPLGEFDLGFVMGIHDLELNVPYTKIDENMYLVDDINSKYYNQLFNMKTDVKDWNSAEHFIDYSNFYEYLVEIKSNPDNIKGKGSAIFLHCACGKYTHGCVSIPREEMFKLVQNITNKTKIKIVKE